MEEGNTTPTASTGQPCLHPISVLHRRFLASKQHDTSCFVVDVTSNSTDPTYVKFSPFYPHGNIPVPFSEGVFSASAEGIWQGLKIFENEGMDKSKFQVKNMKGLKRMRGGKRGDTLGHMRGVHADREAPLLGYLDSRLQIYIPTYKWVLDNYLQAEVAQIRELAASKPVVLLDFDTNANVYDLSTPLSHASLVKKYAENDWNFPPQTVVPRSVPATTTLKGRTVQVKPQRRQMQTKREHVMTKNEATGMKQFKSCGVLVFTSFDPAKERKFLLLRKKGDLSYDLPKGHLETGETEIDCALRELVEETGIKRENIRIDPTFLYKNVYYPTYKRLGGEQVEKSIWLYLAEWNEAAGPVPDVVLTEHSGFEWITWQPPHSITKNTIDPLLALVAEHFTKREQEGDTPTTSEVGVSTSTPQPTQQINNTQTQTVEAAKPRNLRDKDTSKQVRKTRNQRTTLANAGFALLDKTDDGNVSLYNNDDIKFSKKALTPEAHMIIKRNQHQKVHIKSTGVHSYVGEDNSDEEDETEQEREYKPPPRGNLGSWLGVADPPTAHTPSADVTAPPEPDWTCPACTYLNKGMHLACEMCATTHRT
eukprot:TRINITY_DN8506_c0_g1_i1.p1 TRINITY_DN8506_c0_g1~~TRINITY_DN8506_c0_g1_i1.p1  ORF type:complete len:600 (-),score=93.21 TRINITY_DN8506_c0_g1_i1:85-1863(-)